MLILFGIALSFLLLEVGLRLGGCIVLSLQEHRNKLSIRQKGAYSILCLGESTTQGQWPPFLQEILNQRTTGVTFSVIDKGRGGMNTSGILSQIESHLAHYHPDMVVAMMGTNDFGKHMPYERPTLSKPKLCIRSFRTYKLARLLWLHMTTKAKERGWYLRRDKQPARDCRPIPCASRLEEANAKQEGTITNEDSLKKALESNPKNDHGYAGLGWTYLAQGQLPQAEESFKKALESNPKNDQAYAGLGWTYLRQGQLLRQLLRAEESFKKALESNPKNDQAYAGLGWVYRMQGQLLRAEESFKKALELNPKNDWAYAGLGSIYRMQGQLLRAEEYCKKALELNPKNDWACLELGWAYLRQGKLPQAEDVYKKALELHPTEESLARLYGALGSTYQEMGQDMLAEEYYSKANQIRLREYDSTTVSNYRTLKEILDKRKIPLVCVQYPMRSIEPLKKIFQGNSNGILFIDNEKTFKEAVQNSSYREYFWDMFAGDFGHFTKKGNRLLAENIAKVILEEVLGK